MDKEILEELKKINEKMDVFTSVNKELREIKVRLQEFLKR